MEHPDKDHSSSESSDTFLQALDSLSRSQISVLEDGIDLAKIPQLGAAESFMAFVGEEVYVNMLPVSYGCIWRQLIDTGSGAPACP